MKALNPFEAPGMLQAERQRIRRERFKIVMWTVVGANVLFFVGLLIQGCHREPAASKIPADSASEMTSTDTTGVPLAQPMPDTNALITPSFAAPATDTAAEPTVASAFPEPGQAVTKPYVVVKGDSFYKIAKEHGVTMKALAEANPGVDSVKLRIGQALQLPAGDEPPTTSPAGSPAQASATVGPSPTRYVVKPGDTLGRIARAHRTTVRAIKAANGLASDRIVAGRSLKMPAARASGTLPPQGRTVRGWRLAARR